MHVSCHGLGTAYVEIGNWQGAVTSVCAPHTTDMRPYETQPAGLQSTGLGWDSALRPLRL